MAETGILLINKVDPDTGGLIPKSFPIVDVIPSEYVFGYTGLSFEPKKFYWDFGDGTNSDIPKPKHIYRTYGYHKVIFSIMNNGNDWYKIDDIDSHLVVLGKMDFSGEPLRGEKPLLVYLDDNSLAPTGYQYTGMQWDLGDTHGATGRSISHNYLDYGSYTIGINMTLDKI